VKTRLADLIPRGQLINDLEYFAVGNHRFVSGLTGTAVGKLRLYPKRG